MSSAPLAKASLAAKFEAIAEPWKPKIVGQVNDIHVKLVKFEGEFVMHHHDNEDEMFLVHEGHFTMELLGYEPVELGPGEFLTVPRGIGHKPVVPPGEVAQVMMIEPATTVNTGSAGGARTVEAQWL